MNYKNAIDRAVKLVCLKFLRCEIRDHEFSELYFPLSDGRLDNTLLFPQD